jgi:hypothetical protein
MLYGKDGSVAMARIYDHMSSRRDLVCGERLTSYVVASFAKRLFRRDMYRMNSFRGAGLNGS